MVDRNENEATVRKMQQRKEHHGGNGNIERQAEGEAKLENTKILPMRVKQHGRKASYEGEVAVREAEEGKAALREAAEGKAAVREQQQ